MFFVYFHHELLGLPRCCVTDSTASVKTCHADLGQEHSNLQISVLIMTSHAQLSSLLYLVGPLKTQVSLRDDQK